MITGDTNIHIYRDAQKHGISCHSIFWTASRVLGEALQFSDPIYRDNFGTSKTTDGVRFTVLLRTKWVISKYLVCVTPGLCFPLKNI